MRRLATASPILALALCPSLVFASSTTDVVTQLAGLFYLVVGLTLVMAILFMAAGGILWAFRLGTDENYRDEAIRYMEWGVATLFTLILVLAVVEFIQTHTQTTLYIIGLIIIILVIWLVITSGLFEGGGKEDDEE